MFARRVGNLLQAFSCVPRVASIMEMDPRFAEIPVLVDGTVQFIDVETLVLKVHVVQEPCNEFLPLTVRAVEGWVEINRGVTAVKSPTMIKHREGEISEAPISELYSSRTLKQWENSLQYPFFRQASRSRLELGDCLQAGCLQGVSEEFEHGGEGYSLNTLLRGAEDVLVNAVNPFLKLRDDWDEILEFYRVLLSAGFVGLYGVADRNLVRMNPELWNQ